MKDKIIIDAVIHDEHKNSILLQKRSPNRKLFPNMWDLIGGHLEEGETIEACLKREIFEETHLQLKNIVCKVHEFKWLSDSSVINLVYLVKAEGIIIPEVNKVSEIAWFREENIQILFETKILSFELFVAIKKAYELISRSR